MDCCYTNTIFKVFEPPKEYLLFNYQKSMSTLKKCLILNNSQQAIIKFNFRKLQENFPQIPSLRIHFPKAFQDEFNFLEDSYMAYPHYPSQISTDESITSLASTYNTNHEDFTTSTLLTSLGITGCDSSE